MCRIYAAYATRSTVAKSPNTEGPFSATTGVIKQKTPIGLSLMIASITYMEIALALSTNSVNALPFSPTAIAPNPKNSAITITCGIFAFTIGSNALFGKIFTMVSIKLGASAASYSNPDVAS